MTNYDKFIELRKFFENHTDERFRKGDWRLLTKKGALPYEYISPEHYAEKCLPPLHKFISKLTGKSITLERYEELQKIWDSFGCRTLEEFLEIYLESDVLMLADIFENFRNNCLKYYHLDPANYVSAPSLSYHAMLLLSKVVIEPYPSLEIYRMLQRAKHGGLSQVTTRYVRAVNSKSKIIRDYFNDPDFNEKYRTVMPYYLDCNQLYPSAMLYALPVGGYKIISTKVKVVNGLLILTRKKMRIMCQKRICLYEHKVQKAISLSLVGISQRKGNIGIQRQRNGQFVMTYIIGTTTIH